MLFTGSTLLAFAASKKFQYAITKIQKNQRETTGDDFCTAIEPQTDLDPALIHNITIHRGVVMNPFSHYDLEKPEFEAELKATVIAVEKLKSEIQNIKKNSSIDKLEKEVANLKTELAGKDKLIGELGAKLKAK